MALVVAVLVMAWGIRHAHGCEPEACPPRDRALKTSTDFVQGSLKNGLSYIIRQRAQPAGHVRMELCVRAGSMHEPEGVTGVARLLSRLPFTVTSRFAPGQALRRFDEAGIDFDRETGARADFDATRFTLHLRSNEDAAVELGLKYLADIAGGMVFDDVAIEKERRLLLAGDRARVSASQRLIAASFPKIAPGSLLASHPPDGYPGDAARITPEQLRALYSVWYRPSRMMLLIVGDVEAPEIVEKLGLAFAPISDRIGLADPDPGLTPGHALTPMVVSDPEVRTNTAQWLTFHGRAEPVNTESAARRQLVRDLAIESLRRRLARRVATGDIGAPFAIAGSGVAFGIVSYTTVAVSDDASSWDQLVRALSDEVNAARTLGLSAR
ncbi:MAG TPA: insulinase family protein, partial [Phycisphaerales bacterium]|nr:insulinase family protein [Phycisphaerales bacterium]